MALKTANVNRSMSADAHMLFRAQNYTNAARHLSNGDPVPAEQRAHRANVSLDFGFNFFGNLCEFP